MQNNEEQKNQRLNSKDDESKEIKGALTIALAGNPNCGKTTLFNALTGAIAYVGNWPGVTVERRSGIYKNKTLGDCNIVDLPGIYSLSPYSPEEIVARNFILEGKPDCVINVIDGTNLERNLYMTTQIMETDVPMIVAINMMDEVLKAGKKIDVDLLSKMLGVPVIPVSALKKDNLHAMMEQAIAISKTKRTGRSILEDTSQKGNVEAAKEVYVKAGVDNPLFHAIRAMENDEMESKRNPAEVKRVKDLYQGEEQFESISANLRYRYITKKLSAAVSFDEHAEINTLSLSDKIDRVVTNKYLGIPLFLIVLFLMFELTFSEDLFFLNAAGVFGENGLHTPLGWIGSGNGIASPGVFLSNFLNWVTGWITTFFSDIVLKNASPWAVSMVSDGILAGVFAVIGFLPQILVLFSFFSLMEDSGYMARVAFILDRIFRRFGLSGRSFLPMIMGLGCGVPAMLNTRTLTSEKEKIQTIRVIPFFSCSAKLPIITAIAGVLLTVFAIPGANFIVYGVYVVSITTALIAILVMHGTTQREKLPPFIMEFPSYHLPQPYSLAIHVWDKAKHFFKKTFAIIAISTFFIWFFSRFSWSWQYLGQQGIVFAYNDVGTLWAMVKDVSNISQVTLDSLIQNGFMNAEMTLVDYNEAIKQGFTSVNFNTVEVIPNLHDSILGSLGTLITPLFTPMGFGLHTAYTPHVVQGANNGSWAFVVSALFGLIAKENAIGSFGTLASSFPSVISQLQGVQAVIDTEMDGGLAAVKVIIDNTFALQADGSLKYPLETAASLIAFVMFNVTTIPCFASVATAKAELSSRKSFGWTIAFWLFVSYLVGCLTYLVITHWWTIFIIIALLGFSFFMIHYVNLKKERKTQGV